MSDPIRLLDLDGDPTGASLLRAGLDDGPPPGAKDEVYRSIQTALGAAVIGAAAVTATHASAATTTSTPAAAGTAVKMTAAKAVAVKLGIAKTLGIVGLCSVAVVGAGFGVRALVRAPAPVAAVDAPRVVAPSDEPAVVTPREVVEPERTTEDVAPPVSSSTRPSVDIDSLADEPAAPSKPSTSVLPVATTATAPSASAVVALAPPKPAIASEPSGVVEVRSKLRSGDAAGALALLAAMQEQFGAGKMSEDRAVLTIEALAASGNTAAARANADAFLKARPTSPYASRVRTYASN